jgi:hydroxymethylbilane synthase
MSSPVLRIGTRGSPLALRQADMTAAALRLAEPSLAAPGAIEIVPIRTTGDRVQDRPLSEIGGKGLFTKEIEEALLSGAVDLAVHSMKDMPTAQPPGLMLAAWLPREDARDVLVAPDATRIADLPHGARVGTAALRRKAQLLALRPDLVVEPLRGNVDTRLGKLQRGETQATLLALAGLKRLGRDGVGTPVPVEDMLPAVGQGAICIECRKDDARVRDLLARIDHAETAARIRAEHALLAVLDGSCRTPIAGYAEILGEGRLRLRALVARPDGSQVLRGARTVAPADGAAAGADLGAELKGRAGPGFFDP